MELNSKIFVAGHNGMVGSAIVRRLTELGYNNIITMPHKKLDLTNQFDVEKFFEAEKPEYVFLAAAKVGGILENSQHCAEFLYENAMISLNVCKSALKFGVSKLLFLGSSCIYPRLANQPMRESELLSGKLEPTNEGYALAKILGLKYCSYIKEQYGSGFISVMPTNLYGPNDRYVKNKSHVIPDLILKFHEAKELGMPSVELFGDGSALREFLYVDDLADLCVLLMNTYDDTEIINAGSGEELSIKELAELVKAVVGYEGEIKWDTTKPNGTPRKLLDISKVKGLGWEPKTSLDEGLKFAYKDFLNKKNNSFN